MQLLDAHARYAIRYDAGEFPTLGAFDHSSIDDMLRPLIATAVVSLSGQLDACEDDTELDEAARHGLALLNSGVITQADINAEALRVFDELTAFHESYELN